MSVEQWVRDLEARGTTPAGRQLLSALLSQPERASYSSAAQVAALAGTEASNVTRIAQGLGFSGWPALQEELRARYLRSLSLVEIAARHTGDTASSHVQRSIEADQRALGLLEADDALYTDIAARLASATTRIALGGGSFGAVAHIFGSNCSLAGYPTTHLSEPGGVSNAIARVTEEDVVVIFDFWRLYSGMKRASKAARARGATVVVVTDHPNTGLTRPATHLVTVPSEGGAYFPTLAPAIVAANAICSELALIDPDRTREAIRRSERMWTEMGVMG
ncbi:MurR/RpiR family transcriptional regulator [Microbacterium sp. RD1]|uniref:MurR/RpiR family transcriptional regulator n=1 Tax=Microbacterium sp. RD1 TaxID=3457313 RepID=UPI003FA53647